MGNVSNWLVMEWVFLPPLFYSIIFTVVRMCGATLWVRLSLKLCDHIEGGGLSLTSRVGRGAFPSCAGTDDSGACHSRSRGAKAT